MQPLRAHLGCVDRGADLERLRLGGVAAALGQLLQRSALARLLRKLLHNACVTASGVYRSQRQELKDRMRRRAPLPGFSPNFFTTPAAQHGQMKMEHDQKMKHTAQADAMCDADRICVSALTAVAHLAGRRHCADMCVTSVAAPIVLGPQA